MRNNYKDAGRDDAAAPAVELTVKTTTTTTTTILGRRGAAGMKRSSGIINGHDEERAERHDDDDDDDDDDDGAVSTPDNDDGDNEEEEEDDDDPSQRHHHHHIQPEHSPPPRVSAARDLLYRFFYPPRRHRRRRGRRGRLDFYDPTLHSPSSLSTGPGDDDVHDDDNDEQQRRYRNDQRYVNDFWTTFDDILMLSIFTQVGILARLAMSTFLALFDDSVFSHESALFVNLPLNCFSCFCMGLLGSGHSIMEIVKHNDDAVMAPTALFVPSTTPTMTTNGDDPGKAKTSPNKSPSSLDDHGVDNDDLQEIFFAIGGGNDNDDDDDDDRHSPRNQKKKNQLRRRRFGRRPKQSKLNDPAAIAISSNNNTIDPYHELRAVQLRALERRIRASKSLLLFPVPKRHVDIMEHYQPSQYPPSQQYRPRRRRRHDDHDYDDDEHDFYEKHDLALTSNMTNDDDDDNNNDESMDHHLRGGLRDSRRSLDDRPMRSIRHHHHHDDDDDQAKKTEMALESPLPATTAAMTGIPTAEAAKNNVPSSSSTQPPLHDIVVTPPDDENANPDLQHPPPPQTATPDPLVEFKNNVQENVVENIEQLRRVHRNNLLLRGWVKGTTPEEMSDDLLLGLRDGFCGAISSFSSWNSSMVNLLRHGKIAQALVGYMLGIQLPILSYRFGQHVALYAFVWRTRRETRRAERRGGYAIRLGAIDDEEEEEEELEDESENHHGLQNGHNDSGSDNNKPRPPRRRRKPHQQVEIPSLRAVFFALFVLALVTQCSTIYLVRDPDDQQLALSLLFSPLGVLARWRLRRLNGWGRNRSFPLGTLVANLTSCALAGSLGTLLAGNPGPRERIVLVSIIAGFGGTLSSLAAFVVEILAGTDPILLRFDGPIYAVISVGAAMVIAFVSSSSVEWVDQTVFAAAQQAAAAALGANDTTFSSAFTNGTDNDDDGGGGNFFNNATNATNATGGGDLLFF